MIDDRRFPFPPVAGVLKTGYGVDELVLRPFGHTKADIDVDFRHPSRPYRVTQVLKACTTAKIEDKGKIPEEFFWSLELGKRIEALAVVATIGDSNDNGEIPLHLNCLSESCGEQLEIGLGRDELQAVQADVVGKDGGNFAFRVKNREYRFRRPTGLDQLRWQQNSYSDEQSAALTMVQQLLIKEESSPENPLPPITAEILDTINRGLVAHDPLVHFELTVVCPECNRNNSYVLDLEELILERLNKIQQDLLLTIHRLASHYHWSEQQILAVSPQRRAYYLSLIEEK
jgi:hypothetical protein